VAIPVDLPFAWVDTWMLPLQVMVDDVDGVGWHDDVPCEVLWHCLGDQTDGDSWVSLTTPIKGLYPAY
jgi:hypothetical protein